MIWGSGRTAAGSIARADDAVARAGTGRARLSGTGRRPSRSGAARPRAPRRRIPRVDSLTLGRAQDPLVIALLVSFTLPFVILGIAIGTGYVG